MKSIYLLATNKYENLGDKLKAILEVDISDLKLETYQDILDKRNTFAHTKISTNMSARGVLAELTSFYITSKEWLDNVSKKIQNKFDNTPKTS